MPPGSGSGSPAPDPAGVLGGVDGGVGGRRRRWRHGRCRLGRSCRRGSVRMPVPVGGPVPLRRVPLPGMRRFRLRRHRRRDGSHRDRSRPRGHGGRSRRAGRPVADGRDRQHTASASAPSPPAARRGQVRGSRGSSRARCSSSSSSNSPAIPTTSVWSPACTGLVTATLELVQALRQRLVPGCGRSPGPLLRAVGPARHHPRRAGSAASVRCPSRGPTRIGLTAGEPSSGRSRKGVGPGPTAQSPRSQASTGNLCRRYPLGQTAERQRQPGGVGWSRRRVACHRSMLMPSDGATTRNLRPS